MRALFGLTGSVLLGVPPQTIEIEPMANPTAASLDTVTPPFARAVPHQGWLTKLRSFAGAATRNYYSKTSISWRGNESGGDRSCEGKRPPPSHNHRRVNASTVDLRSIARLWSHYNGR